MKSAIVTASAIVVCSVMAPLAVMARGTGHQADAPDMRPPTALEQALIERGCGALLIGEARQQCLGGRLLSLRTDFGHDLSRLSAADRQRLDTACNQARIGERRDAYLECLDGQLLALRTRRTRANPAAAAVASPASPPVTAAFADPPPPVRQASWWRSSTVIGATVASVLAVAAVALLVVRTRRARHTCRVCGTRVSEPGDLCATCRHQAAEVLRQAAAERTQQQRAQEDAARRQRELEVDQRAREEEDARLRQQESARQRDEAARLREEEARRRQKEDGAAGPVEEDESFDPYSILGVTREATSEAIRTAYEEAKSKYHPDMVANMGVEVQLHFAAKAKAVERAYQMLAGVGP